MRHKPKPEEKLVIRYSEFKLALLTVVLLFFIVFPFLLPARITIHQNIIFVVAVLITWLGSAIIYLLAHISKLKVKYSTLCYLTVITDIVFLSAILYILPGINSNYFFLYIFVLIGASFYLEQKLVVLAGVLSSFVLAVAFFIENEFPISASNWLLFVFRILFILASTYFVYLFILSFKGIIYQKKKIQKYSNLNREMLVHFSNQLRAPLPVIRDFVEQLYLEKAGPLNSKQKDILKLLHKNTDELINGSANIVYYNQIKLNELYINKKEINLVDLIGETITACSEEARNKGVEVIYRTRKNIVLINTDKIKLFNVLCLFVKTIIDKGKNGTKIRISAKKSKFSEFIKIKIAYSGEKLCKDKIKMKDNFDLFVSSKIIEKLGGNIEFISKKDCSQKIIVIMPV